MSKTADQTIGSGANVLVTWEASNSDGVTVDLANEKVTIDTSGWYTLTCSITWVNADANDLYQVFLMVNATDRYEGSSCVPGANSQCACQAAVNVELAVDAYVECYAAQDSGNNDDIEGSDAGYAHFTGKL